MYNCMRIQYADGSMDKFNTEPMGKMTARDLMLSVFYHQSDTTGGSQIVSIRFFQQGKGKPLYINREAL